MSGKGIERKLCPADQQENLEVGVRGSVYLEQCRRSSHTVSQVIGARFKPSFGRTVMVKVDIGKVIHKAKRPKKNHGGSDEKSKLPPLY